MARDDMPPMVVSSSRAHYIEPYANRLRAADPIKWGEVFPWEFPQNATRQQEEAFLREWFSLEEIHVQGGAGNTTTPGPGYRFLKQVWYFQAIWNWEQRVPALNEWWWKNAESAGLIHDTSMRKYILDPNVELKTFFQSEDLEMYGEKFLRHVVPVIQQTARARIEEQKAPKKANSSQSTRAVAHMPVGISASEPLTAPIGSQAGMSALSKTTSQPQEAKPKMVSPVEMKHPAPQPTIPEAARPRKMSSDYQASTEQPQYNRKRGNSGGRRYSGRGGQSRQPNPIHDQQMPQRMQGSGSTSAMPNGPYEVYPPFDPTYGPEFIPPHGPGQPVNPELRGSYPGAYQFPTIDSSRYPATFATPPRGQQPQIIWVQNPLMDRGNGPNRHVSYEAPREPGYNSRGGREYFGQDVRGGKARGFSGDRGRGRGHRGGRSSFGSHGQAPAPEFQKFTPHDFRPPGFANKARRGSVISVDKNNWRSGSEHPQGQHENMTPARATSTYVPAPGPLPFEPYHPHVSARQAHQQFQPPLWAAEHQMPPISSLPDDPRYHCTSNTIGELCPYATRLAVLNVPLEATNEEVASVFREFGTVVGIHRLPPPPPQIESYRLPEQIAFVEFSTAKEARACLLGKPETWLRDNRPLRVEVPRIYWDPTHPKYRADAVAYGPSPQSFHSYSHPVQGPPLMHRSQDSSSTVRGPVITPPEQQTASGETTPTASGTSTPKKKKPANKNKNKNKKDPRSTSLAKAGDAKADAKLEAEDAAVAKATQDTKIDVMGDNKVAAIDPALRVDVERLREGSESTERQTTSEPSFTPVDEMTTKLPTNQYTEAGVEVGAPAQNAPVPAPGSTEVQPATERPPTPADSASVHAPAATDTAGQLFRDHEAEKTAPSEDVTHTVESQSVGTGSTATKADAATPTNAEEEHVDDSFHTATGSPSSAKDASTQESEPLIKGRSTKDATEIASTDRSQQDTDRAPVTQQDTGKAPVTKQTPSQQAIAPDSKGESKASSGTVSLTVDTDPTTKGEKRKAAKRSVSGGSALATPAAFVTAPNTPLVEQASETTTAAEDAVPAQPKKVERSKGPQKTESLSMFGKKQEKKPKQQKKKGTLKGKPKELSGTPGGSQDPSRDPSPAPGKTTYAADVSKANEGKGDSQEVVSTKPTSAPEIKAENAGTEDTDPYVGGATTPTNLAGTLPPTDKEPLKKRTDSIFNKVAGFFTGSQSQSNVQEKRSTASNSANSSLTDMKVPGEKATEVEPVKGDDTDAIVGDTTKPHDPDVTGSITPGIADPISSAEAVALAADGRPPDDDAGTTGLGITNSGDENDQPETEAKSKKKKKKSKKKSKKPADSAGDIITPDATPELEDATVKPNTDSPFTFRFEPPQNFRSDHSDASSITAGPATPSTGTTSPVTSKLPRRLPFPPTTSDHVLQGKEPKWKNKKRTHRTASGPDESTDEEKNTYALEPVDSKSSNSTVGESTSINVVDTATGMQTPRTVFVLPSNITHIIILPSSSNDEQAGESETQSQKQSRSQTESNTQTDEINTVEFHNTDTEAVKEGRAKMQRLLEQESKKKHGRKASQSGLAEAKQSASGQSSRIEELSKLYPGRTIFLITPVNDSGD